MMKKNRNNAGQGLAEWALILPVFIVLFMGVSEFGIMISKQHILNNISKEITRSATIGKTSDELVTQSLDITKALYDSTTSNVVHTATDSTITVQDANGKDVTITFTPSLNNRVKGEQIKVVATYTYDPFTLFFSFTSFDLTGEYYSRIEVE